MEAFKDQWSIWIVIILYNFLGNLFIYLFIYLFDSSESFSKATHIVSGLIGLVSSIILGDSSLNWNPSEIKNGMACEYDPYV